MIRCSAPSRRSVRRGLTLVELMLALAITAMIGAAIAAMMAAVASGVGSRRDMRAIMLRGYAAHTRVATYFTSARCVLGYEDDLLTIWLNDVRESETVHGTEIRWFWYRADESRLEMLHVSLPSDWTEAQKAAADKEYPIGTRWDTVLEHYAAQGLLGSVVIVDAVASLNVLLDDADPLKARLVTLDIVFEDSLPDTPFRSTQSLRFHHRPKL